MHKIAFLQPNFQTGPTHLNSFYLPYTVGILWSYAKQNQDIADNYSVKRWVFRRDPVEEVVRDLADCSIAFFSLYVWNRRYCFEVARQLKKAHPNVLTVFGGPDLPHRDPDVFIKYPFMDIIVAGEGEQCVQDILLKHHNNEPIEKVFRTTRIKDLDIPSPYLTGLFDNLMEQHPEIEWVPTIETDRGCPYQCTFCDWGGLTASKVIKFGLERVFAELEWLSEKKLPFLSLTSANFGIFRERDTMIADKIVELSLQSGYPSGVSVSYAKNSNADVFNIVKKFKSAKIQSGFILSLQTTTKSVLENIKRTNMNINDISKIANFGRQMQIAIFTEVIMGLPGETLESWKTTLDDILSAGLHNGIDTFFLNMIENAPMISDVEKYDIKTFPAYDMFYETSESLEESNRINESVDVIKSNSTLSEKDLEEVLIYTWYLIGFHIYGVSDIIAIYLKKNKNVEYKEFYDELINYVSSDSTIKSWELNIRSAYRRWHETGILELGNNGIELSSWQKAESLRLTSWQISNSLSLMMHYHNLVDHYIKLTKDFVINRYNVDLDIADDYELLSMNRIKQWGRYNVVPKKITTKTTLFEYTQNQCDNVVNDEQSYMISDRYDQFPNQLLHHIDNIIYGRRRTWVLNLVDKA
jgi:radical SAM superfamily enzyme YgiQ (UPF0313 family)